MPRGLVPSGQVNIPPRRSPLNENANEKRLGAKNCVCRTCEPLLLVAEHCNAPVAKRDARTLLNDACAYERSSP
jgi:hypothetical protein